MSGEGYIKLSRGIFASAEFQAEPFTQREAFIWMLCEAAWKPYTRRVGDHVVSLERGQLAFSLRFLADAWGWHRNRVDRYLKALENRDTIGTATGTGVTVITIRNYNDYQGEDEPTGTGRGQKPGQDRDKLEEGKKKEDTKTLKGRSPIGDDGRTAELPLDAPPTTTEEIRNDEHAKPKQASRYRIDEDWRPDQKAAAYARERGIDIEREAIKFARYWAQRRDDAKTKRGWGAAWRNWCDRAPEFTGRDNALARPGATSSWSAAAAATMAPRGAQAPACDAARGIGRHQAHAPTPLLGPPDARDARPADPGLGRAHDLGADRRDARRTDWLPTDTGDD